MKTKEELQQLRKELLELSKKLSELTKEELEELDLDELEKATGGTYKKDIGSDKNAKVIF